MPLALSVRSSGKSLIQLQSTAAAAVLAKIAKMAAAEGIPTFLPNAL